MNEDELFHELFHVPLKIFRIYHAGDYEREKFGINCRRRMLS